MNYTLKNGVLTATVSEFGAELVSVLSQGREQIWQNSTGQWNGHAPVLFPVCGRCGVVVNGKSYPIERHGFARKRQFRLLSANEEQVSLILESDGETKKAYPFCFRLVLSYRLEGSAIEISYLVENTGEELLPFSYGGHESFLLYGKKCSLHFPQEEVFITLVHDGEGKLTGEKKALGAGRILCPEEEWLRGGNTLIFSGLRSRSAELFAGEERIATSVFSDIENLLLWRPDGADMICVEPWYNLPDRAGEQKELKEKGIITISPNGRYTAKRKIIYG